MNAPSSDNQQIQPIFPAGFAGSLLLNDFDEMAAAARGWDQHYTKLRRGAFSGGLTQAHTARLQLGTVAWNCDLLVTGTVPKGAQTFLLVSAPDHSARIGGNPIPAGAAATRSDHDELYFVTSAATGVLVLSLDQGLLDRTTDMMFGAGWREIGGGAPVLRLRDATGAQSALRRVLAGMCRDPARLVDPAVAAIVEEEAALSLLSRLDLPAPRVHPAERLRAARRVDEYLHANGSRPVTIAELCAATGTRERTLHVACREYLGLPPGAYLRVLRLHAARRDLRELGPATTVTDTATRWGFFHFGEFSAAYRRLFGELPSQTAGRAPGEGAARR